MEQFANVLFVFFGWLLGTLSPGVVEAIGKRKRRAELMLGFAAELSELRFRIVLVLTRLHSKLRTMDQGVLDITKPLLLSYRGDREDSVALEGTKQLLARGDAAYIALHNSDSESERSLYPVPYQLPFLSAHVPDMTLFPVQAQQRLLRILGELALFNEQVALVRRIHDRTFDSGLSPANYQINSANLSEATKNLAVRATALIGAISSIVAADGTPIARRSLTSA